MHGLVGVTLVRTRAWLPLLLLSASVQTCPGVCHALAEGWGSKLFDPSTGGLQAISLLQYTELTQLAWL